MTGPFSVRRNAQSFDAALSRTREPLTERDARAFAELLAVVRDLRSIPELEPRPEFVADLRSRLMTAAETALLPQSVRPLTAEEQRISLPVRARSRDRRLAAILGGAALIGATTSMAVAAQTALPGESLYPVKRALEDAQRSIARDEAAEGRVLLASARGRLDEVDELAGRNDPASVSALVSTLETFSTQTGDASVVLFAAYDETGDEDVIIDLRSFTSSSMLRLSNLQSTLPPSASEALVSAGERLAEIDRLASQRCPTCGGPASISPHLLSDASALLDVRTVIVSASQDPDLINPVTPQRTETQSPATPDTISGQDVEVPELTVPVDGPGATPSTPAGTGPGLPGPKSGGQEPVNEVTQLLTGVLEEVTTGLPVTNEVVSGVGTAVDGTLAELPDTQLPDLQLPDLQDPLDEATDSPLLP